MGNGHMTMSWRMGALGRAAFPVAAAAVAVLLAVSPASADPAFRAWIETLWPDARAAGVSRATFDAAFKGVEPDLSLPDLATSSRPKVSNEGQAEFTKTAKDYLDTAYLARLAARGRELAARHAASLRRIETEIGVDGPSVLAIWGRETSFGAYQPPHDAIRALATEAYLGRRKELFRGELIAALRMLESGVPRAKMRSSWAGAMGLAQFIPSEYFAHARDMDGDGKADLFGSAGDALGSAAQTLKAKGWVLGQPWGYEVAVPEGADCGLEGPKQARPLNAWATMGFRRTGGAAFDPKNGEAEAYLMMPAGAHGPAFLVFENYRVIRRYNTSDLYAVFVGHLADRIAGGGDFDTPWAPIAAPKTKTTAEIQERLGAQGYPMDKIDGKIGSNTRQQIGAFQRARGLAPDCWPSDALLAHLRKTAPR